jgi:hypothetical protein
LNNRPTVFREISENRAETPKLENAPRNSLIPTEHSRYFSRRCGDALGPSFGNGQAPRPEGQLRQRSRIGVGLIEKRF